MRPRMFAWPFSNRPTNAARAHNDLCGAAFIDGRFANGTKYQRWCPCVDLFRVTLYYLVVMCQSIRSVHRERGEIWKGANDVDVTEKCGNMLFLFMQRVLKPMSPPGRDLSVLYASSYSGGWTPPIGGQELYDGIQTQSSDAGEVRILYVSHASKRAPCFVISN
jgi:hypothetical protein